MWISIWDVSRQYRIIEVVDTLLDIGGFRLKIIVWISIIRVIPNVARFGDLIKSRGRRRIIPAN
jgi:hypothetical protein